MMNLGISIIHSSNIHTHPFLLPLFSIWYKISAVNVVTIMYVMKISSNQLIPSTYISLTLFIHWYFLFLHNKGLLLSWLLQLSFQIKSKLSLFYNKIYTSRLLYYLVLIHSWNTSMLLLGHKELASQTSIHAK